MPVTGGDPVFTLPLGAICRASIQKAVGKNLHLWALLCGCCFGERDKILNLDLEVPAGWLCFGDATLNRVAGSVRLGLYVRDADEWVDAMQIRLLLEDSEYM